MKNLVLVFAAVFSTAIFATTASRGYIMKNRNFTFYAGLMDDQNHTDIQTQLSHFTSAQVDVMQACMEKAETHAILVESEEVAVKVPRPDGRMATVHEAKIINVECVRAPGFLKFWKTQFGVD